MTYYKFLLPDRLTPGRESKWPVRVGAWAPNETPVLRRSGWHASETAATACAAYIAYLDAQKKESE